MSFSVIGIVWLEEHRALVVECFYKIESYVAVQCAFRKKFKLKIHDSVPSCVTISKWLTTFRETNAATSVRVAARKRSI